jgi:restriction system protein
MAKKIIQQNLPSYDELIIPTVKALIALGGSGSIEEINTKAYKIAQLPETLLQ